MSEWGPPGEVRPRHRRSTVWDALRVVRRRFAWVPWEYVLLIGGMALIMKIGFK